jgi:hypothetical protein
MDLLFQSHDQNYKSLTMFQCQKHQFSEKKNGQKVPNTVRKRRKSRGNSLQFLAFVACFAQHRNVAIIWE